MKENMADGAGLAGREPGQSGYYAASSGSGGGDGSDDAGWLDPRAAAMQAELDWQQRVQARMQQAKQEQRRREAAQKAIEQRAMDGMDGPRPCMCENGKLLGALQGRQGPAGAAAGAAGGKVRVSKAELRSLRRPQSALR